MYTINCYYYVWFGRKCLKVDTPPAIAAAGEHDSGSDSGSSSSSASNTDQEPPLQRRRIEG